MLSWSLERGVSPSIASKILEYNDVLTVIMVGHMSASCAPTLEGIVPIYALSHMAEGNKNDPGIGMNQSLVRD